MQKIIGIPQNRERVFIVSIRNDVAKNNFCFPQKVQLMWKLKDLLEDNVDNKYYLSEKAIGRLIRKNNKLIKNNKNPEVSSCIIAGYYKMDGRNNQYITKNINSVQRITGIYDKDNKKHQAGGIYNPSGLSPTLTTMEKGGNKQPFILVNEGTNKGVTKAYENDSINVSYPNNIQKRGRVGKGISQTILTSSNIAVLENINKPVCLNNFSNKLSLQDRIYNTNAISASITASQFRPKIAEIKMFNYYNKKKIKDIAQTPTTSGTAILISEDNKHYMKIRKLTPLECWRLMGFDDKDFYKAKAIGISDTQLYKQAGNSIVVNVLEYIFEELFDLKKN